MTIFADAMRRGCGSLATALRTCGVHVGSAAVLLLLALAMPAGAQMAALVPGSWVRFATADSKVTSHVAGRIVSITHDSITIEAGDELVARRRGIELPKFVYPTSALSRIEIRTEAHGHAALGFMVGLFSGAAIGALTSHVTSSTSGGSQSSNCGLEEFCLSGLDFAVFSNDDAKVIGGVLGGLLGGLLGAGIGAAIQTEVWAPIDTRMPARVQITPRAQGLGVGLSFSLP